MHELQGSRAFKMPAQRGKRERNREWRVDREKEREKEEGKSGERRARKVGDKWKTFCLPAVQFSSA